MEPDLYDFTDVIKHHAKKYGAINKVPYEDLYQQGVVIFYDCINGFDDTKKTTFRTYLSRALEHELRRYACKFNQRTKIGLIPDMIVPSYRHVECRNPETIVLFWDMVGSLSREALEILVMLLKETANINLEDSDPGRKMRGKLRKYAHKELGMPHRKIDKIFKEMKAFTSTALSTI